MKQNIEKRSTLQGFEHSRLPTFTEKEIEYLKGTVDLLGVNCYSAGIARHVDQPEITTVGWSEDQEVYTYVPDDWPIAAASWLTVCTTGLPESAFAMKGNFGCHIFKNN